LQILSELFGITSSQLIGKRTAGPANPREYSYFPFFAGKQIVIPITWLSGRLLLDALIVTFASRGGRRYAFSDSTCLFVRTALFRGDDAFV
jgi:hypothetical protein